MDVVLLDRAAEHVEHRHLGLLDGMNGVEKTEARKAAALVPSSRCRLTPAMPAIHQGMGRAYCQCLLQPGYQVSRLDARSASIARQPRRGGLRRINWPA